MCVCVCAECVCESLRVIGVGVLGEGVRVSGRSDPPVYKSFQSHVSFTPCFHVLSLAWCSCVLLSESVAEYSVVR